MLPNKAHFLLSGVLAGQGMRKRRDGNLREVFVGCQEERNGIPMTRICLAQQSGRGLAQTGRAGFWHRNTGWLPE
jgi:hypothetical protein